MSNRGFLQALCFFGILVIVFSQISCRSTYKLGLVEAKPIGDNKLYKQLTDSSLNYSSFYAKKISVELNINDSQQSFKGALKIQKDSIIWISVNAPVAGIEVARIIITPDSLKLINRINKSFFAEGFDFLSQKLNIDVDYVTLESILTNSIFEFSKENNRPFFRNFKGKIIENQYVFISEKEKKINRKLKKNKIDKLSEFIYQRFEIDPFLFRITSATVKQFENSKSFSIRYSEFMDFNEQKFPQQLLFKATSPMHLLSCKIKFNKIEYDKKLNFSFSIPDKYQKIYH